MKSSQKVKGMKMVSLLDAAVPMLQKDEDYRKFSYKDTRGNLTIGYGHNLDAKGMSKSVAQFQLLEDLTEAINGCKSKIPFFTKLDTPRQLVLVNMAFNMGIGGLLSFVKMLDALSKKDYQTAAKEIENSLAAKEVPNRMHRLVKVMESGQLENIYSN